MAPNNATTIITRNSSISPEPDANPVQSNDYAGSSPRRGTVSPKSKFKVSPSTAIKNEHNLNRQLTSPTKDQASINQGEKTHLQLEQEAPKMPPMGTFTPPRRVDPRRAAAILARFSSGQTPKSRAHHSSFLPPVTGFEPATSKSPASDAAISRPESMVIPHATHSFIQTPVGQEIVQPPAPAPGAPVATSAPIYNVAGASLTAQVFDDRFPELRLTKVRPVVMISPPSVSPIPFYYAFFPENVGLDVVARFPHIPSDLFGMIPDNIIPSFLRPATFSEAIALGWVNAGHPHSNSLPTAILPRTDGHPQPHGRNGSPNANHLDSHNENVNHHHSSDLGDDEDSLSTKPTSRKGIFKRRFKQSPGANESESSKELMEQVRQSRRARISPSSPRPYRKIVRRMNKETRDS